MAALSITAASVVADSDAVIERGTAGATITAGQPVYEDTANSNVLKLTDSNASALAATVKGVALHGAASGQPLAYITSGNYTVGATVTVGQTYVAGATAGDINPISDIATGWYVSHIGIAISSTKIRVKIHNSGVAVP